MHMYPMPASLTDLVTLQFVGCLPTLALVLWVGRASQAVFYGWEPELWIFPLAFIALAGWLGFKLAHLVLLLSRSPRFLQVYHIGCIFGTVAASVCLLNIYWIFHGVTGMTVWPLMLLLSPALIWPLGAAMGLSQYYLRSTGLQAWLGSLEYLHHSPLCRAFPRAVQRQTAKWQIAYAPVTNVQGTAGTLQGKSGQAKP